MKINATIFKPSGKYYTDEEIEIPDDTMFWDYDIEIKTVLNGRYSGMVLVSEYENEVPFMMNL